MNKIREVFNKPRVFLPVVHCMDRAQVEAAVAVAIENGADGVWLINQGGMNHDAVLAAAKAAVPETLWGGVNLLGFTATRALEKVYKATARAGWKIDGVWSDDASVRDDERATFQELTLGAWNETKASAYTEPHWRPLYFGGVAFKHRRHVPDELLGMAAAKAARDGVDVVTTSGPETGTPPSVDKVKRMRDGLGSDHALAIASGVTPKNIRSFLPYVDAFLVATGIEKKFGTFDPKKLKAVADAIHAEGPRS